LCFTGYTTPTPNQVPRLSSGPDLQGERSIVTGNAKEREKSNMPWKVGTNTSKGYPIKRSDTGKIVGYSTTKEKAAASVRARYASVGAKGERFPRRAK